MKHKDLRPWLSVIAGGESLVSHAGGVLLVETARRSGLAGQLSRRLGRWRRPLAVHDPGKIVTDMAIAVALGGDAACDIAVLRALDLLRGGAGRGAVGGVLVGDVGVGGQHLPIVDDHVSAGQGLAGTGKRCPSEEDRVPVPKIGASGIRW